MTEFITKDSGERTEFESGMQRDTEAGKPRFDLIIPENVPYQEQFLTRVAALMGRGAEKYNDRNWEKADSEAEMKRMKSSAFRHFMQWLCGETDEDHAAAVVFNLLAHETTKAKLPITEDAVESDDKPLAMLHELMTEEPHWLDREALVGDMDLVEIRDAPTIFHMPRHEIPEAEYRKLEHVHTRSFGQEKCIKRRRGNLCDTRHYRTV